MVPGTVARPLVARVFTRGTEGCGVWILVLCPTIRGTVKGPSESEINTTKDVENTRCYGNRPARRGPRSFRGDRRLCFGVVTVPREGTVGGRWAVRRAL